MPFSPPEWALPSVDDLLAEEDIIEINEPRSQYVISDANVRRANYMEKLEIILNKEAMNRILRAKARRKLHMLSQNDLILRMKFHSFYKETGDRRIWEEISYEPSIKWVDVPLLPLTFLSYS
jgi:hypothetical protein